MPAGRKRSMFSRRGLSDLIQGDSNERDAATGQLDDVKGIVMV